MSRPPLALVVAVARNGAIGRGGGLPWRVPEDLKRFKAVTMGHAVVMGRKTHESIGKPLPGRRNIVVTRRAGARFEGCEVAPTLEAALALARATDPLPMVIGGAQLYAEALPRATRLYLTELDRDVEADTFFPALDRREWREVEREAGPVGVTFLVLERA